MSIARGPFFYTRRRPISSSMRRIAVITCRGVLLVSSATAQFRNHGCSVNSTG